MRCPACGARNSEDASWCTQCYADLSSQRDELAPPAPGERQRQASSPPDAAPARTGAVPSPPPGSDGAGGARDVRERDGEVEWRCAACEGWNPLLAASCTVCGTPRRGFGEQADAAQGQLDGTRIVAASLILPGLGHVLAGRSGTGLARAILAVLWLVGGLVLVLGNAGIGALPGWVLLISVALLWAATAVDARSLVAGATQEILATRRLGAFVLAVTMGLILSAGVVVLGRS